MERVPTLFATMKLSCRNPEYLRGRSFPGENSIVEGAYKTGVQYGHENILLIHRSIVILSGRMSIWQALFRGSKTPIIIRKRI
jgi:hypothetical protein